MNATSCSRYETTIDTDNNKQDVVRHKRDPRRDIGQGASQQASELHKQMLPTLINASNLLWLLLLLLLCLDEPKHNNIQSTVLLLFIVAQIKI